MPIDFLIRKKVTLHVGLGILDSMPIANLQLGNEIVDRLAPLALRLTCTGAEMTPFWNQMAEHGWVEPASSESAPTDALLDESARANARAEIDAIVAKHLYGLSRDDLEFIIGTFPTLERNEIRQHGEFRTRRLVLDWFEKV